MEKIGQVAHKLGLPTTSKMQPVFHVSLLKKKIGSKAMVQTELPSTNQEGQFLVQLLVVLQRQLVKRGEVAAVKVLFQWSNLAPEDAT